MLGFYLDRGCAFIGITVFGSIVESVEQDRFVFGGQRIRVEVGMKLEVVVCQQKFLGVEMNHGKRTSLFDFCTADMKPGKGQVQTLVEK